MDFAAELYTFLSTNETITEALPGGVHHINLPQGQATPAAVFREMDPGIIHAMGGDDTTRRPEYEIECHAETTAEACASLEALEAALQDFTGPLGNLTCQAVLMDGGAEDYDPDTGTYWKSREFTFFVS